MVAVVCFNTLLWTREKERLGSCSPQEVKAKARAWLDWRSAPKSIPRLRTALAAFVDEKIAELAARSGSSGAINTHDHDSLPTPSEPLPDPQDAFNRSQEGALPAESDPQGPGLQHVFLPSQLTLPAAVETEVQRLSHEVASLRKLVDRALRALHATGGRLCREASAGPASASAPLVATEHAAAVPELAQAQADTPAEATKEVVFFGLPLEVGASAATASNAVQQFCSERLQVPIIQLPDIVRVSTCRPQCGGFTTLRPATVVVARVAAPLAHAIFEAKRTLDSSCPVSIDGHCTPGERRRRQALRLQRHLQARKGGEGTHEGGAWEGAQAGEGAGAVEVDMATLH